MEREIKFRGLVLGGEYWLYGYLIKLHAYYFIQNDKGGNVAVIENTVGQYTGLKDKNGVEIYQGDILKISLYDSEYKTHVRDYLGTLVIDVEQCEWNTTAISFLDDEAITEVIGNIHEHAELLK